MSIVLYSISLWAFLDVHFYEGLASICVFSEVLVNIGEFVVAGAMLGMCVFAVKNGLVSGDDHLRPFPAARSPVPNGETGGGERVRQPRRVCGLPENRAI